MEDHMRGDGQQRIIADSIRRHVAFILVVAIAFTCAAGALTLSRHAKYTSTAKVLVTPLSGNPLSPESLASGTQITVAMTTEAAIVDSPDVLARAAHMMRPAAIPPSSAVHAIVPPNTRIVQIRVSSGSATVAANAAEAYAKGFLAYRKYQAQLVKDQELKSLTSQQTFASERLAHWSALAAAKPPKVGAATQVQVWAGRLAAIKTSIGNVDSTATAPGKVITSSVPPNSPDGLNPALFIAAALVLGLCAGVVLAIWRERRDDRIRNAFDHSVAGAPILAILPGNRRLSPLAIAGLHADDDLRTAYRRARAGVIASAHSPSVLVVSSADRGSSAIDPATEVAANLGWSLTGAGFAVTIVDATIGHGHLGELLGIDTAPGLSEQLVAGGAEAPRAQESLGMSVVAAGRDPEGSREFYAGARLLKALGWFTEPSDYVIVAGPPANTPDGEAVALVGDAIVLIVVDKETTHRQVFAVVERLSQLGVRVVGAVGLQRRVVERARSKAARTRRRTSSPQVVAPATPPIRTGSRPAVTVSKPTEVARRDDGR